ncbi:MAG: transcription antitermination factor NusB, partial [Bacteroidota bacterium]
SFELYLFNVLQLVKIAEYAKNDAAKRASKHLPSEEDKRFTPKLYENDLIQSLIRSKEFFDLIKSRNIQTFLDDDTVRRYYVEFAKTDEYKKYLKKENSTAQDHKNILLLLFRSLVANESFDDEMEGLFISWMDDKSLVIGSMKKTIKAMPLRTDFFEAYRPSAETTVDFGEALLRRVVEDDQTLLGVIEPTLKNWDVDRVAVIDMILLKMALCELTCFPTIPTKVTLNEFVEISKLYSTDKSKDFINGILDRLMKQLNRDGRIKKEGRGLVE